MPGKKSKQANQGISWKIVLAILGSIATLVSAIVGGLDFINYLREGYQQFLWLGFAVLGLVWLIILWLLFKQRNIYGVLWFAVTIVAGVVIWNGWHSYIQTREEKLVVLIAKFDGPEDNYGVRTELMEKLRAATKDYPNIEIDSTEAVVNTAQGSEYARDLGKKDQADIVIWGWYRPTENPNITIHIENLSPKDLLLIRESETYQPVATIADLESFEIQKRIGTETANLVDFLAGYLQYQAGDYVTALELLDQVRKSGEGISIINQKYLFVLLAGIHYDIKQYQETINDCEQVLQTDPYYSDAYNIRGAAYYLLEKYAQAVLDFDLAIKNNPDFVLAYFNRANSYNQLGQYDRAVLDLDHVIRIDPSFASGFGARGYAYNGLGQPERAIQDYDTALRLNPRDAITYNNRGIAHNELRQYQAAIEDYDQAIYLDPTFVNAYDGRAYAYTGLHKYELAIENLNEAIQIDSNYANAYKGRGTVYQILGKSAQAEADFKKYEELTGQKP